MVTSFNRTFQNPLILRDSPIPYALNLLMWTIYNT
jgi:hypothetical protein